MTTLANLGKTPEKSSRPAAESGEVRWSSHPIQRYTVGRFQFEKGLLTLTEEADIEDFQATYDSLPVYEKARLQKIDVAAAERIVQQYLNGSGSATKGIDSSTGDRAPNNQTGTGRLEDSGEPT